MEGQTVTGEFTMLDKFGMIFSDPKKFFNKIKSEKTVGDSLGLYVVVALISGIASFMVYAMMSSMTRMFAGAFMGPLLGFSLVFGIIATFVYAGVVHLLLILTKGDAHYVDTYNACTYSLIPTIVFSIVPGGFIAVIYSFILMVIGMSEVHNISKGRAVFVLIMPAVVVVTFFIFLALSLLFAFGF